jgi:hypothetical protein
VAGSYAPGAVVSEVARRHDISPQHLFAWRKAARAGVLKPACRRGATLRSGGDWAAWRWAGHGSGDAEPDNDRH